MSAPTPGPWIIRPSIDGSGDVGITAPGLQNVLAETFGAMRHRSERATDEAMANARLIAAAPDLLEALEMLLADPHSLEDIAHGKRMVAKARGVS